MLNHNRFLEYYIIAQFLHETFFEYCSWNVKYITFEKNIFIIREYLFNI